MGTENRTEKKVDLDIQSVKGAFATLNALKFVLDLNGGLNSNIDKEKLIRSQSNLLFKDIEDIFPDIDELKVDGIVVLHPEYDEREEHTYSTLEDLEKNLFELGKSHGFIEEI